MADQTTNQDQQPAVSAEEKSQAEQNGTEQKQAPQQQLGPGPKVLLSHYRGMPKQWAKNKHLQSKKEGEKEGEQ